MSELLSLGTAEPNHRVSATETRALLASLLHESARQRIDQVIEASRIQERGALAPLDVLCTIDTLEARTARYRSSAVELGSSSAQRALDGAGLQPGAVDLLIVTTSTGVIVPGLDVLLRARLGLRADARSLTLFGLGCSGAARGMGLAHDLLASNSALHALVVSVELCSLWLPVGEPSPADAASVVLLGDGVAAAVLGTGQSAKAPAIVAHHSVQWPQSLNARSAHLTATGFRHYTSCVLPRLVQRHLRPTLDEFLARCHVNPGDLRFVAINPSDHRSLEAASVALDVSDADTRVAWESWAHHGNTLSAGPLFLLQALQTHRPPADGDLGVLVVLGPGITCDLMLLRWFGPLGG